MLGVPRTDSALLVLLQRFAGSESAPFLSVPAPSSVYFNAPSQVTKIPFRAFHRCPLLTAVSSPRNAINGCITYECLLIQPAFEFVRLLHRNSGDTFRSPKKVIDR
jgi:hypothetical protein